MAWNYFSDNEVVGLETEIVAKIDQARHLAGIPFVITDGKRYPETNTDPNAVANSAHLKGQAVDLRCRDSHSLWKMLQALFAVGFKRIGVYAAIDGERLLPTHLHVDTDLTKPQEVVFLSLEK